MAQTDEHSMTDLLAACAAAVNTADNEWSANGPHYTGVTYDEWIAAAVLAVCRPYVIEEAASVPFLWMTNSYVTLRSGEMTAGELRSVKAAATAIRAGIKALIPAADKAKDSE